MSSDCRFEENGTLTNTVHQIVLPIDEKNLSNDVLEFFTNLEMQLTCKDSCYWKSKFSVLENKLSAALTYI